MSYFSPPSFVDPGPHGTGRYSEHMMPEVEKHEFRKGSQVPQHMYKLASKFDSLSSSGTAAYMELR